VAVSVVFARGFKANGLACGIKENGDLDLSVVISADGKPVPCVATFTTNRSAAAPVQVSKDHLAKSNNLMVGWILSSGNANAATGKKGVQAATSMCDALGSELGVDGHYVGVCSTGLIGIDLPVEKPLAKIAELVQGAGEEPRHGDIAAEAIRTTDTFSKFATYEGSGYRIGAMAKGAAMIAPNMATMLAVITTDATLSQEELYDALKEAVDESFNLVTIDGCTSTNDTVVLMSSGLCQADEHFRNGLKAVCKSLADQIALDAEGATKLVRVSVKGAVSYSEALMGARKVAESQLVKCSFYGEDPYWGRVASELGSAGIEFDLERLSVSYQGVVVAAGGVAVDFDSKELALLMREREIEVVADLSLGGYEATITTTDLGPGYIEENKGTS
jgi:glutamate N-acetyltransferase/amino-acid N-acetyltransferase